MMISEELLKRFCSNRNIKCSTLKSYRSAIAKYEFFHDMAMGSLMDEAIVEEDEGISLKNRKIKSRLLDFRSFLLDSGLAISTVRTYFSRIKTFYRYFEIELPYLNDIKFDEEYLSSYYDLPARGDIMNVCSISSNAFRALVLFISSSGCAKAETLSLTVGDFVKASDEYHDGGSIDDVLNCLIGRRDIVPAFYLKRIKTNKFYYAFCSPEASHHIVKYLISRKTGVANLVDAMLVIAVGLLVFLVISWNMQAIVFNDDISPDQRQDAINAMKQVTEIDQGQQLNETPDVSSSSGEGYSELGKVYKDSNTGKLIMIEN